MIRPPRLISATLLASSFFAVATQRAALGATCTAVPGAVQLLARAPSAGDFIFPASDGLTIPMDIDERTGTVTVHRGGLPALVADTRLAGPVDIQVAGADVTGSLDAAGNLVLPGFSVNLVYATLSLPTNPTLATGPQSYDLSGKDFVTQGVALDFASGMMTLAGADFIASAPTVSERVVSGLRITCQLSPIPVQANLPHSAGLKGLHGKVASDALTLRATFAASRGTTIDLKKDNVFVRIASASGAEFLLLSRAPDAGASQRDRTVVVLSGLPSKDSPQPTGIRVTIRGTRRKATVSIRIPSGLALSGVTGQVLAQVTIGSNVATAAAVANAGKLKTAH